MLIFKTVRWKNLLATGNHFLEVSLNSARTTILLGESGSGKSTLLDAISFALFNRPFRNINKTQIVNSINEKNCVVELEFSIGTKEYLIRRGVKPTIFEIYCDNQLINQDSHVKDYQQHLEKQILKFNFKAFCQIVVLGASNFTPFMQLKPADRRVIIEGLLDIEIFSAMNVLLKQKMANLKTAITEIDYSIALAKEKIALHQKYLLDASKDKDDKIKDNLEKIKENEKTIEQLKNDNIEIGDNIKLLEATIVDLADTLKQKAKIQQIVDKLHSMIKKHNKEIDFYKQHDTCPTCHQEIVESFKFQEIHDKIDKIEECSDGVKIAETKLNMIEERLSSIAEVEHKIKEYNKQISDNLSTIQAINQFIKKLANETLTLKEKVEVHQDDIIVNLKEDVSRLSQIQEQNFINKTVYELALSLLKDNGVKSQIIKQYLPLINKYTNQFLTAMNFFITFSINEEFDECIKHRGRDDLSYANFSEGEKQRIDLALLFTWRKIAKMKNSVNTNLLVLDEVLDSYLDTAATENVLQLVNSDLFKDTNVFVISHKESIADKFHANIRFTKKKNFSIIE